MYRYTKHEIIQDMVSKDTHKITKKTWFDSCVEKFKNGVSAIGKTYTKISERISEWYGNIDFAQAGHDTARFLFFVGNLFKRGWNCFLSFLGYVLMFYPLLLFVYCGLQFFLLFEGLRPEILNTWMNTWNMQSFPVLFQGGHPFLQTYIFFVCLYFGIRTIMKIVYYFKEEFGYVTPLKFNLIDLETLIFTIGFTYIMFQSWVYYAIGIYMILCLFKFGSGGYSEESHGFSLYDRDGNFVGTLEKF